MSSGRLADLYYMANNIVTVVQYRTTPDAAEDNHELITQVFAQLQADRPDGVRYAVFRLDDGVSFVHIVSFDGDDTPLTGLPAFMAFQRDIGSRLTGPPTRSGATIVGSYGFIT